MNRDDLLGLILEMSCAMGHIHEYLEDLDTPPTKSDYRIAVNNQTLTKPAKAALLSLEAHL